MLYSYKISIWMFFYTSNRILMKSMRDKAGGYLDLSMTLLDCCVQCLAEVFCMLYKVDGVIF